MARVLTKIRIDEVSAVPKGAGEGVRVLLMKRAPADEPHVEEASRRGGYEKFLKIFTSKAEADDGGNDAGSLPNHPVVQAARLLVASEKFGDYGQALDFLLNKPAGQALLTRLKAAEPAKESTMDSLASIAKDIGIVGVAKAIVSEQRSYGISESEFVGLVTEHAAKQHPELRPDAAFAKLYESEEIVRRACSVLKSAPLVADLTPLQVGGTDAQALDDPQAALAQLPELGQQRWPNERPDVQFSRAFELRPDLAVKAHRRPSPTTSFAFPTR
jgi:hypothetical protein